MAAAVPYVVDRAGGRVSALVVRCATLVASIISFGDRLRVKLGAWTSSLQAARDRQRDELRRQRQSQNAVLDGTHWPAGTRRYNRALGHLRSGRRTIAIRDLERLQGDQQRKQGADHPDTLRTKESLADAYCAVGRAADAIPIREQVLVARERILGPDHPDTQATRERLLAPRAAMASSDEDETPPADPEQATE